MKARIAAVIAAGGVGSRFSNTGAHKQLYVLQGKPLYMWCLLAFCAHPDIDSVVVVAHADILDSMRQDIARGLSDAGLGSKYDSVTLVTGGGTRQESVYLGLQQVGRMTPPVDFVMVHDAARPFLTRSLIDRTVTGVTAHGACTVAIPVSDTVKRVSKGTIVQTLDRSELYAVHTPQAARLDWLLKAHADAKERGIAATDDAFILEQAGYEVKIVESDKYNIKVTIPDDLLICEAIAPEVGQIMESTSESQG